MAVFLTFNQLQILTGIIYETCVISISIVILLLVGLRYREKRNQPTLLLLLVFANYTLGVVFSIIAKIIIFTVGGNPGIPGTLAWYFLQWMLDFRLSEVFVILAVYCSYAFIVKIFQSGYNQKVRVIVIGFAIFAILVALLAIDANPTTNQNLIVISFLMTFFFMCGIYMPFSYYAIESYRKARDARSKGAFQALTVMAISFALVFFWFMLDQLWSALYNQQYTVFYFLAWTCGIVSLVTAYFGFIRPRARQAGELGGEPVKSE